MIHSLLSLRSLSIVLVTISALTLSACQGDKKTTEKVAAGEAKVLEKEQSIQQKVAPLREVVSAGDAKTVEAAFLRDNLPDTVLAYARIPNFWSFIGSAKGNIFDKSSGAKTFVEAVKGIRSGLYENVIPEIPDETAKAVISFFFHHLTSPVEAIVIEGVDPAIPTPNLVISAGVNFNSITEIQNLLLEIEKKSLEIEIKKAMQDDGYAELNVAKASAQLKWDKVTSRFTLLLGVSLSPNNLTDLISTFVPNPDHQMKALENTIDSSGQGTFVWANPRKLSSIGSALGMQKELAPLAMMGVSSMKNIAIGTGTSGGINRLKYVVEMPITGFRSYMPIIKSTPEFNVKGKTKMVAVMGLPSRADFVSIENTIALVAKPKDMESYFKVKKEFKKALGFEIEDIFEFFGQDISYVSDEAGSYIAIRLNNAELFKSTLKESVETLGLEHQERTIGGFTYNHLKIPSFYTKYLEEEAAKKSSPKPSDKLLKRFLSIPSHIYWEQEGEYLIMSDIPQTLMDRHYVKTTIPVKDWLEKEQRINPDGSLIMASIRSQGTARKMYRMHLSLLNFLADFTGKPIDMFELATPLEAQIPYDNSYGLKVTSSEDLLAFELNFESNPYEFLFAGNATGGLIVLGMLSSIAMPAYDDYKVRADVVGGITAAQSIKLELNEFEIEYGRYPNEFEIDDLKLTKQNPNYSVTVASNMGEIIIKYKKPIRFQDTLKLIPPKQGVSTIWTCESKINRKYLPAMCK